MAMRIVLRDVDERRWLSFDQPRRVVSAHVVVNATGVWTDEVRGRLRLEGWTLAGCKE